MGINRAKFHVCTPSSFGGVRTLTRTHQQKELHVNSIDKPNAKKRNMNYSIHEVKSSLKHFN